MDKTKTAVILCIVIIVMLGGVLYACRDKFTSKSVNSETTPKLPEEQPAE